MNNSVVVPVNPHTMTRAIFENGVLISKVGFVLVLLILAFVNAKSDYVDKNTKLFMANNMVVAGTAALSTLYIALNRGSGDVINKVLIVFLFMFFFQVCRELSGYYGFMGEEEQTDKEKSQMSRPNMITGGVIMGVGAIIFLGLSLWIWQKPPMSTGSFVLETIIFSIILALGETFVTYAHGEKTATPLLKTTGMSFVMFVIVAFVLQYGGFYEHVFKVKNA